MTFAQRKPPRLHGYDYSKNGAYFITICTYNRLKYFGAIVNDKLSLNNAGTMVSQILTEASQYYQNIHIDQYVVMPNHVHAIIILKNQETKGLHLTLSEYIKRFKTLTTKLYIDGVKRGEYKPFSTKVWQKSFHDHIIRNESNYTKICEYIANNPLKWREDRYYSSS